MANQKIRSVIIEDELYDQKVIRKILETYYNDYVEVIDSVSNEEEAILSIRKHQPQLLFLDIELNGDRYGAFHILDKVEQNFKIIFVTAKSEQDDLLKAIKLSCIDYLVKPTKISDFELPIRKVFDTINNSQGNNHNQLELFRHNVNVGEIQDAKISLQSGYDYFPIAIKNIIRCESQGNYTHFYFVDKSHSLINGNLKSFEDRLSDYGFCRISKHDLINLSQIKLFSRKNAPWEIKMQDQHTLYVSAQRRQHFLHAYDHIHLS